MPELATRAARIRRIRREHWIDYHTATTILDMLEESMAAPRTSRMPNLLIVGETNNGKSRIVGRFAARHRAHIHLDDPRTSRVPVLLVQAPNIPDEGRFYNAVLSKIYAPFRPSARADQRQLQVYTLLDSIGVRILIIDEIHNILAGSTMRQQQFRNMLKNLGNELAIPIVGVGTREAHFVIQSDRQLENRFEPILVPRWQMGDEFLRLLASFERRFALERPSELTQTSIAIKTLAMSEGTIGELSALLTKAAIHAVRSGTEQITPTVLDECGYSGPSARRKRLA